MTCTIILLRSLEDPRYEHFTQYILPFGALNPLVVAVLTYRTQNAFLMEGRRAV